MITAGPTSWNIRDRHMVHTLENLMEFHGADAKGIIWEHNHIEMLELRICVMMEQ
jgi:erythromycin esterase-like protein